MDRPNRILEAIIPCSCCCCCWWWWLEGSLIPQNKESVNISGMQSSTELRAICATAG